jgi:glycosyltransferase involved in cell wall biosynthesis
MARPLCIGVVSQLSAAWTAGLSFTRVVLGSLARRADPARERVVLLAADDTLAPPPGVELIRLAAPDLSLRGKARRGLLRARDRHPSLRGEWAVRDRLHLVEPSDPVNVARRAGVDVIVPWVVPFSPGVDVARVGWLPDFQHRALPQFFSAEEIAARDAEYAALARRSEVMILSSESVAAEFRQIFPDAAHKATVARFPSLFAHDPPAGDPRAAVAKYRLPEKFALIVNQLWAHKNHPLAVEAVARAAERGVRVPLVMVGAPFDYRDRSGKYLSGLLQAIASRGVGGQVSLLGQVPFADLVGLLRAAAVVVQPSRCEGWSTTVEDAKALGRPLICSDLPVLREQAPDALGFAGCDDPEAMADVFARSWDALPAGPDAVRERAALEKARLAADAYGDVLLRACHAAVA